ncbi:tryptophan 7-halogenase [Acinetobacter baumannii]|uniref:NAD(P)/FAD-dependent oxidoreductase n=1 Tax=Acinetobacter baumannii TaxID=470 RepID=UPI0024481F8C|nr:tryptophan 7-halogenase [Acinetobacter baumannii]MDH2547068.1 tryptophan 7-halogenase [Acinetobacter baumannii]MDV7670987.1 tryptophan 7-halogenase [Acinetobacter baumannii]
MKVQSTDVLIIGGSMAGSCLARQLKLEKPELTVTVLEKKKSFDHGIGESMLEIFWDYACKDLGLSKYLESNYYYKHGLRFFFEREDKDTSITDMSEIGRTWYHTIPAHQIDRSKFDEDLVAMNEKIGIITERGVSATEIIIGEDNHVHEVLASNGKTYQCRWLVDASGLAGALNRKLKDVEKLDIHPVSAAWMRVKGLQDLDSLGDKEWKQRVRFTNRSLSTNHFMYRGYWVWLIPLDANTYSIGVVWHHQKSDVSIKSQKDLEEFLLSHKWAQELFGSDYEVVDFSAIKNMARIAKTIFSPQRWFRTGMSAGFIDPLFSSGSAWLTDLNRMIVDIIRSDLEMQSEEAEKKIRGYDLYAHWWYENFLLHITGNYHGNYEMHKVLFRALFMDYFGIVFPASVGEYWKNFAKLSNEELIEIEKNLKSQIMEGGAAFAHKIKDEMAVILEKTGEPLLNNLNKFHDVEIPSKYMMNAHNRGQKIDGNEINNVRQNIEVESLLEATKSIASLFNRTLSEKDLRELSESYLKGDIKNLNQGLKNLSLI